MTEDLRRRLRVELVDGTFTLAGRDPAATPLIGEKRDAKDGLDDMADELFDLHEMMFATKERAVLLVLQGTDASGKNGTIKHVVRHLNPAGVRVTSFDEPTEEEASHHFLWRIRKAVPAPGELGVFDRSHYEDVIVPMAENAADHSALDSRIEDIVAFEQELVNSGIILLKCMLHISYDEQRRRFLRRLRRDDKRWKFSPRDLETRRRWDDYERAMGHVVARTSTDLAPWHVVPADHKWYRNWAIARMLVETWRDLNLAYPQPELDLAELRASLEPPG